MPDKWPEKDGFLHEFLFLILLDAVFAAKLKIVLLIERNRQSWFCLLWVKMWKLFLRLVWKIIVQIVYLLFMHHFSSQQSFINGNVPLFIIITCNICSFHPFDTFVVNDVSGSNEFVLMKSFVLIFLRALILAKIIMFQLSRTFNQLIIPIWWLSKS